MKKIILLLCFISLDLSAQDFTIINYKAKSDVKLSNIIKLFLSSEAPSDSLLGSVKKTISSNTQLEGSDELFAGEVVQLYINTQFINVERYERYKERTKVIAPKMLVQENKSNKPKSKFSIFSMPSFGYFSQSRIKSSSINYVQISPFSLGLFFGMTPQGSDFGISASIYYSYLLPTTSKGADGTTPPNKVSIPPELGGNLYGLFPIQEWPILYGGLDIEKFSSFNLDGIVNENIVYIDRNTILYVTAGIIKKISEGNSSYTFKFSLSKSIMGTFENGNPDPLSQKTILSGYKIMAFTSIKMSPDWSTDMMVKYHSFSGDNTLSTMRIGVGLTYSGF